MNGIFNVLKPTGMTSHDVVSKVRKITKIKKVGHTGTLDPNAAGVLPICIGKGTKIAELILNKEKSYRGEVTLGIETDTYDSFGKIINKTEVKNIKEDRIYEVFEKFKGEIVQVPPIYSAIKIKGKKLYEFAREGQTDVEIKSRKIFIKNLEIIKIKENKILFDVSCSKGTYIRSLCKDIGDELGFGGYMSFLLRTSSGNFTLENAVTLEELEEAASKDRLKDHLFNIDFPLEKYKSISIRENALKAFVNGNIVYSKGLILNESYEKEDLVKVYVKDKFYGIGKIILIDENISLKSHKLFV